MITSTRPKQGGGACVTWRERGVKFRQRLLCPPLNRGPWITEANILGKWRYVANVELPRDGREQLIAHPMDAVCGKCGVIYSHLFSGARQPCDECRSDAYVLHTLWLQDECGVDLGVRMRSSTDEPTRLSRADGTANGGGIGRDRMRAMGKRWDTASYIGRNRQATTDGNAILRDARNV